MRVRLSMLTGLPLLSRFGALSRLSRQTLGFHSLGLLQDKRSVQHVCAEFFFHSTVLSLPLCAKFFEASSQSFQRIEFTTSTHHFFE